AFTGFVLKLNGAGGFKWAGAQTGDWWSDAFGVTTDAAGNIYVTGELNGTNTFDITGSGNDTMTSRGQDDAYLAKYDAAGHLAWVEAVGSDGYDHGMHVALGMGGKIVVTGYFSNTAHFGPEDAGGDLVAVGEKDSFIAVFDETPTVPVVTVEAAQTGAGVMGRANIDVAVTPAQGVATGKVVIRDGTRVIGTLTLDASGHATLRRRGFGAGTHTLTATYLGDVNSTSIASEVAQLIVG
ncbi:MAG TPA: Ig-like domain-containing protein, partial [Phycisphaerae bacterium]|nr:Ig-like domain-containing protein [Phycisphaerae bacterium]